MEQVTKITKIAENSSCVIMCLVPCNQLQVQIEMKHTIWRLLCTYFSPVKVVQLEYLV